MIKPLFDRVLVEPTKEQKITNGIYVPLSKTERGQIMQVVAVGAVKCVSVGDKVIINKYSGAEVTDGGTKQYLVKEIDILGVVCE